MSDTEVSRSKRRELRAEGAFILGALLFVGGIAHFSPGLASMVAGGMLMFGGYLLTRT